MTKSNKNIKNENTDSKRSNSVLQACKSSTHAMEGKNPRITPLPRKPKAK